MTRTHRRLHRLHLNSHPLSKTAGAEEEAAVIEAASAPFGKTLCEVSARFKAAALAVPKSSSLDEGASNKAVAAAALAASAEAFTVSAL